MKNDSKSSNSAEDKSQAWLDVVILSHGLDSPFGTQNDMNYIDTKLRELDSFDLIINPTVNLGKTGDGIEPCGQRLYNEVLEILTHQNVKYKFRISVIAHSLGGLITRVLLKYLYHNKELWNRILPVSYMSLSTPHLGVRRPQGIINTAMDVAARVYIRGETMSELVLEDGDISSSELEKQPLLLQMSNPKSEYLLALKEFKHRTLFAIVKGDYQVPFCSASISSHNHYDRGRRASKEHSRVMGHSGFSEEISSSGIFDLLPSNSFNPLEAIRDYFHSEAQEGEKASETKPTSPIFRVDAYGELEFLPQMIHHLNQLSWRRVDLEFSRHFAHDLLIKKATVPILANAHEPGEFAVDKITRLLIYDHNRAKQQ